MKFTAAGDLLIQRCLPVDGHYDGFGRVRDFIYQGDFRFANIEGTVHQYECPPSEESGGSWLCITPDILDSIKAFGFNMYALANNHSLDYSFEGVAKTLEYTRRAGLKTAGTGMTLSEASEPVYLDCRSGRIALIAATSTFKRYAMAGAQSAQMMGRPGVNGIRIQETFLVTPEDMDALKRIAEGTAINAYRDIIRKEGYLPQLAADTFEFGTLMFKMSDKTGRQSSVNEQDMKRVEKAIFDARLQADAIVVSLHAHEISGTSKETPDYFIQEFARRSIDAGAHAVVGHGPHLLRPIEIYKGRPIFYSLGDFILQNENILRGPEQFFTTYGLTSRDTMHDLFATRSAQFTRGLQTEPKMFEALIPYWEMNQGKLTRLLLMPVELGFGQPRSRNGWPRFEPHKGILQRVAAMSEAFGTRIEIRDGIGEVVLDQ